MSKTIEVQMREILDHASKEVREATQRAGEITAKEAVQKLKTRLQKANRIIVGTQKAGHKKKSMKELGSRR